MQSALLASSLVALAAGSSADMPDLLAQVKASTKVQRREMMKTHLAASADSKDTSSKKLAQTIEAELMAEGVNMRSYNFNNPGRYFEVVMGETDCDKGNAARVQGYQMGRCLNSIENFNLDEGNGVTSSLILTEPNNGGFPIVVFYWGHQCVPENVFGKWRVGKQHEDFGGFDPSYRVGECASTYGDGGDLLYKLRASWEDDRFKPAFDHRLEAVETKNKACLKEKYFSYTFERADICLKETGSDSEHYMIDVSQCNGGGYVKVKSFGDDPNCAETSASSTYDIIKNKDCLFDTELFLETYPMEGEGYSDFFYIAEKCYVAPPAEAPM